MDLIAKLPCIAAKIYRNLYREGSSIGAIDSNLDWSHNFTNMLGYNDAKFTELMRLYLTIHRFKTQHHAFGCCCTFEGFSVVVKSPTSEKLYLKQKVCVRTVFR